MARKIKSGKKEGDEDSFIPVGTGPLLLALLKYFLAGVPICFYMLAVNSQHEKFTPEQFRYCVVGSLVAYGIGLWLLDVMWVRGNMFILRYDPNVQYYKGRIAARDAVISEHEAQQKSLASEIDFLKSQLQQSENEAHSKEETQREQINRLHLEMQIPIAAESERRTVASGRDAMDQLEAKIRSLQESLDEMTKSRDMALNNLADKEHLITKLLLCVQYLQSLRSLNELLQEDNEVQLSRLLDAEGQVSDLEQQLAHLQECLDHQQRLQTATANDKNNAVTRIGVLSAEVEHSKSVIENERTVTKNLQADLQASGAEIADLTSQLESVVAEKGQLSEQVASLQTELKARPTVEVPAKQASVQRMGGPQAVGRACEKCAAHATTIRLLHQQVAFLNERTGQIAQTVADTLDIFEPADNLERANTVLSGGHTVLSTLVADLRKLTG